MTFVLHPSRHLSPWDKHHKHNNNKEQQNKKGGGEQQSMASLAALWPGYARSKSASAASGAGVTKRNSSKRKSKEKKPKSNSVDVTGAEVVQSVWQAKLPPASQRPVPAVDPATASRFAQRPATENVVVHGGGAQQDGSFSRHGSLAGNYMAQRSRSNLDRSATTAGPRLDRRESDAVSPESKLSPKLGASTVSPMFDSFNNNIWPTYSENNRSQPGLARHASLVSPLSGDSPRLERPHFGRTTSTQTSRDAPPSRSASQAPGYQTPAKANRVSMASRYSPKARAALDGQNADDNPYNLTGPETASAFDESPSLKYNMAVRNRKPLTMEESIRKPLPPKPQTSASASRPVARRDVSARPPEVDKKASSDSSSDRKASLPRNPLPHHLDSLDDAFRRSGLLHQQKKHHEQPQTPSRPQSQPQPQPQSHSHSQSRSQQAHPEPSPQEDQPYTPYSAWRKASDDLEAHLSKWTSSAPPGGLPSSKPAPPPQPQASMTTDNNKTTHPQPHLSTQTPPATATATAQNETDKSSQQQQQQQQQRPRNRTFDMDSLRVLRAQAHEKVAANSRFRRPSRRGSKGSSDPPAPPQEGQNNSAPHNKNNKLLSPPLVQRHGPQSQTANPALSERVNRTLSFARSRRGGERNLRLRLPRLMTTELSGPAGHDRNNLSVVVESPAELDGKSVKNNNNTPREGSESTATEKIVSALSFADEQDAQRRSPMRPLERVSEEGGGGSGANSRSLTTTSSRESNITGKVALDRKQSATNNATRPELPASVATNIIQRIMENVDNLEDLFSLAVVNRGFYRVLKQRELPLIKNTLFRMSPPAWELREMSPPWENDELCLENADLPVPEYTAESYMRHYTRDLCTMIALKSLILVHCESFLRPVTARALAGIDEARSAEVDDAFWRVWSFCRIFGCGKSREEDIPAQADWLSGGRLAECDSRSSSMAFTSHALGGANSVLADPPPGFSNGNPEGLTAKQLHDMMEIWTCLGVLLQVFHGKCEEARRYGVFDDMDIEPGDITREAAAIEGWTQYLLTLGPSAVLTLISLDPSSSTESMFARAQSLGWTKWKSPTTAESGSTRWFLKEAVSRVFNYQLVKPETSERLSSTTRTSQSSSTRSRSSSPGKSSETSTSDDPNAASRQRQAGFAAELRQRRQDGLQPGLDGIDLTTLMVRPSEERPISSFQEVVTKLDGMLDASSPSTTAGAPPVPPVPDFLNSSNSTTPTDSLPRRRHTRPSIEEKISQGRYAGLPPLAAPPPQPPAIQDPADIALNKMVKELGFAEKDAKWALKNTDTGESLDVEAAINLLLQRGGDESEMDSSVVAAHRQAQTNAGCGGELSRSKTTSGIPSESSEGVFRPAWRWA